MKRFVNFFDSAFEVRQNGSETELVGVAVPYNKWSQLIYGYFRETFAPGAFAESLASDRDVICTRSHDWDKVLGSTVAETLKLEDTDKALKVRCTIPNTTYALDLAESIKRKDVRGMSFIFTTDEEKWNYEPKQPERTVLKAKLYEVCFTCNPAYPDSKAGLRTSDLSEDEVKQLIERNRPKVEKTLEQVVEQNYHLSTQEATLRLLGLRV